MKRGDVLSLPSKHAEQSAKPLEISKLSFHDAYELARNASDPNVAAETLFELADRESITEAQRAMAYEDALPLTEKLKNGEDRLAAQATIMAYHLTHGNPAKSLMASQMLTDSFAYVCRCESATCDSLEGRKDCADYIDIFVEFIDNKGIAAQVLRIDHPSLRTRVLLRELANALKK
jgi:hypothetical protein